MYFNFVYAVKCDTVYVTKPATWTYKCISVTSMHCYKFRQ